MIIKIILVQLLTKFDINILYKEAKIFLFPSDIFDKCAAFHLDLPVL